MPHGSFSPGNANPASHWGWVVCWPHAQVTAVTIPIWCVSVIEGKARSVSSRYSHKHNENVLGLKVKFVE